MQHPRITPNHAVFLISSPGSGTWRRGTSLGCLPGRARTFEEINFTLGGVLGDGQKCVRRPTSLGPTAWWKRSWKPASGFTQKKKKSSAPRGGVGTRRDGGRDFHRLVQSHEHGASLDRDVFEHSLDQPCRGVLQIVRRRGAVRLEEKGGGGGGPHAMLGTWVCAG